MKTGHPYIAGGTPEQRETAFDNRFPMTYRQVTRGWWRRGYFWGFCIGWALGSVVTYILLWLTGNL